MRVDITAAACAQASTHEVDATGDVHCGTSYATPLVTGVVAAMLSINPQLQPEQVRMLLRRSAMTIGGEYDFEPMDAEDLTAPILPSERNYELSDEDVGRSARLDMQKALDLAVQSRDRVR
jgi:subtilisin family serine protease